MNLSFWRRKNQERGAFAVVFAVSFVALLGAAGIGMDSSNVVMRKQSLQHGVDAAALAIARECALGKASCTPSGNQATASSLISLSASGATVQQPVIPPANNQVRVTATQDVTTPMWSLVGVNTKPVAATATATWGGHPMYGAPPLPLAVPYCQWLENKPGTSSTPTLLRSDLVGKTMDTTNTLPLLNRLMSTLLPSLLNVTASCKAPDGQDIAQMRGPVWLTGVLEVLAGLIDFFPAECKLTTDDVNVAVGGVLTSALPPSCIQKLGTVIKKGDVILLPIYVPANNLLQLGLETKACGGILGSVACVSVPPKLGVKIIGYAPFKVTGWNFPGNVNTDPSAPSCSPILTLLSLVSIGCNGITGNFIESVQPQPEFTYGEEGADFGGSRVVLSE